MNKLFKECGNWSLCKTLQAKADEESKECGGGTQPGSLQILPVVMILRSIPDTPCFPAMLEALLLYQRQKPVLLQKRSLHVIKNGKLIPEEGDHVFVASRPLEPKLEAVLPQKGQFQAKGSDREVFSSPHWSLVKKGGAQEEVLEEMALANANKQCKAAILSLPMELAPTLDDVLQLTESLHLSDTDWHLGSLDLQVPGSWQHVGIFVIKKANKGKWRLLHDLCQINNVIEDMGSLQPGMPSPAMLPQNWNLAIIDIKDCFFQIPLHPDDAPCFAFSVPTINREAPRKRYHWKYLPQRARNSLLIHQWYLSSLLSPVCAAAGEAIILHYMDDVLVCAPNDDLLSHVLDLTIDSLVAAGFALQEENIQRMPPWKYLGLEIGKRTIVPQKLAVKNNIRTLADVQQLCESLNWVKPWLGLTTEDLDPLFNLFEGGEELNSPRTLTQEARAALEKVQDCMATRQANRCKSDLPFKFIILGKLPHLHGMIFQWEKVEKSKKDKDCRDPLLIVEWVFLRHHRSKRMTRPQELVAELIQKARTRIRELAGCDFECIHIPIEDFDKSLSKWNYCFNSIYRQAQKYAESQRKAMKVPCNSEAILIVLPVADSKLAGSEAQLTFPNMCPWSPARRPYHRVTFTKCQAFRKGRQDAPITGADYQFVIHGHVPAGGHNSGLAGKQSTVGPVTKATVAVIQFAIWVNKLFGPTPPVFEGFKSLNANDIIQWLVLLVCLFCLAFRDKGRLTWITTLIPTLENKDTAPQPNPAPQPDPAPQPASGINHPDWVKEICEMGQMLREYLSPVVASLAPAGGKPSPCPDKGESDCAALEPTDVTTVQVPAEPQGQSQPAAVAPVETKKYKVKSEHPGNKDKKGGPSQLTGEPEVEIIIESLTYESLRNLQKDLARRGREAYTAWLLQVWDLIGPSQHTTFIATINADNNLEAVGSVANELRNCESMISGQMQAHVSAVVKELREVMREAEARENRVFWMVWIRWPGTSEPQEYEGLADTGSQCTLIPSEYVGTEPISIAGVRGGSQELTLLEAEVSLTGKEWQKHPIVTGAGALYILGIDLLQNGYYKDPEGLSWAFGIAAVEAEGIKKLNSLPGLSENPSAVGLLKVEEQRVPVAALTVHRWQYRTNRDVVIPIHKMICELESQGVVSKTHSPFNSPIWPVPDGEWRLTVDYHALNKVTPPLSAAVPDMLELQ
ncbi:hypothetical protein DUI87_30520 [Hirundo rustica rustica]|uniref:ribonuclease H n=1 Tax=Hirundo rustica rustica TaxID=333673 RepID=A0A3M0IW01_HIRRU|nr:hypothetical protein DUI87_30520 [Hirundo rustica rustica]